MSEQLPRPADTPAETAQPSTADAKRVGCARHSDEPQWWTCDVCWQLTGMGSPKPCPFCGCERVAAESKPDPFDDRPICWAECQHCGAQGPATDSVERALAEWHGRTGKGGK